MTSIKFPSPEWLQALFEKLNSDQRYNSIASRWEGDIYFDIRPDQRLAQPASMYLDLWHGLCRGIAYDSPVDHLKRPRFILTASYANFTSVLMGELHPMTAMMTSKLKVEGDLGYMMRHVPTVLDFVRCAREVTTEVL